MNLIDVRNDIMLSLYNQLSKEAMENCDDIFLIRESLVNNKYSAIWASQNGLKYLLIVCKNTLVRDYPIEIKQQGIF